MEKPSAAGEYLLTVRFVLPDDTAWAKKGCVIAWDQLALQPTAPQPQGDSPKLGKLALRSSDDSYRVDGDGFTASIDRKTGGLTSYKVAGREMLTAPLLPNFHKANNDNQQRCGYNRLVEPWRSANEKWKVEVAAKQTDDTHARVEARFALPVDNATCVLTYVIRGDGNISVLARYEPGKTKDKAENGKKSRTPKMVLPRFGVTFAVPRSENDVKWYGRGPGENYWDRKTGYELAIYENIVDKMWFPYCRAQDTGNHTDTRWFTITDGQGKGLRIDATGEGCKPVSFSTLPFTVADIEKANHPTDLPRRDFNTVFVDWKLHGVGGDNSWGAWTHPQYTLPADQPYSFRFEIEPIR